MQHAKFTQIKQNIVSNIVMQWLQMLFRIMQFISNYRFNNINPHISL